MQPAQTQPMQQAQPQQQQQIQQQQQQAMLQMLNQSGSIMPMASAAMNPQQAQNAPGPMGGPSAVPNPRTAQFIASVQDVPLQKLVAQLTKDRAEHEVLMQQLKQNEANLDPNAANNLKNAIKEKHNRITMINNAILLKRQQQQQQQQGPGMMPNAPGPGSVPGMPMGNNGLMAPSTVQPASQPPNQPRSGPSPSMPQQQQMQPIAANIPPQPTPPVTQRQAQQQAFMLSHQHPSNAAPGAQRLQPGMLNNGLNGNVALQQQQQNMQIPVVLPPQQQQQPPQQASQPQTMGMANGQPQGLLQRPPQIGQAAPPQMMPMQPQQQSSDMQLMQRQAPAPVQQQSTGTGQAAQHSTEFDLPAYMLNSKPLTDAQVDHMRVLMPSWSEKDKFIPLARQVRDRLVKPCPRPEFLTRWMRYANSNATMLQRTFSFATSEVLKVEGVDINIYDLYALLVTTKAFNRQMDPPLDFYARVAVRVGIPAMPGQVERSSLQAATSLKTFADVTLAPIHDQFLQDHEQSFLYSRMLTSFFHNVNGVQQWRADIPPPPPGPIDAGNAAARARPQAGTQAPLPQSQQDELWYMVMTSSEARLRERFSAEHVRRLMEEVQRMPQTTKQEIRKRIEDSRAQQRMLQQQGQSQPSQMQAGPMSVQMPQPTPPQGMQNPTFAQAQMGAHPPTQSSPANISLASLQQGMNQFPVQPPAGEQSVGAPLTAMRLPITDPAQAQAFVNALVAEAKTHMPNPVPIHMSPEVEQKYWQLVTLAREVAAQLRHELTRYVTIVPENGSSVLFTAAPKLLMLIEEQVVGRNSQPPRYYLQYRELLETIKRMYTWDTMIRHTYLNMQPNESPGRSPYWPSSQWLREQGIDPQLRIINHHDPDPEMGQAAQAVQTQVPGNLNQQRKGTKRSLDEGSAPPTKRGRLSGAGVNPSPSPAMVVPTPGPSSTPHMDASQTPVNAPTVSDTARTPKSPEVNKGKGKTTKSRAPPKRKSTKPVPSTAEVIVIESTPKPQERGIKRPRDSDIIVLDGAGEDEPTGKRAKLDVREEKQPVADAVVSAPPPEPAQPAQPAQPPQPAYNMFLSMTRPEDITMEQALAQYNELRDQAKQGEEEAAKSVEGAIVGEAPDQPADSMFAGLDLESEVMEWVDWDFGDADESTPELEKVAQSSPETTDSNKKAAVPGVDGAILAAPAVDPQPLVDGQNVKWDWENPVISGRWAISETPIIY
ncbi:hypothetical protein DACRYDRAFT_20464 [Dacryopinax primogenitus]|uniref:Uncharacterized protein n=1 Tax=Dacryopinax primogenitus (strain DJM 731) TaxID=1858805 RepID=M5G7W7_DACPD|nr:uncharacterized protein DACRYDRAFT_20464 [Dacryopinax primogenitus]EJU04849.1 hypothetical protein DACRYDRAFT_20464 [Dacryopinax primogenitus]